MDLITVAAAAQMLGISEVATRSMFSDGRLVNKASRGPAKVSTSNVLRVRAARRAEALRYIRDETAYARQIRDRLRPPSAETVTLVDGREAPAHPYRDMLARSHQPLPTGRTLLERIARLEPRAVALWGRDVLTAAVMGEGTCRWCWAHMASRVHDTADPQDTPALRVLLGEPCAKDAQRWREESEARRVQLATQRERLHRRQREETKRHARQELSRAQEAAQAAVARHRLATERLAALDPASVRQTGVQARRRDALACGCTSDTQCARHEASDRAAKLRALQRGEVPRGG